MAAGGANKCACLTVLTGTGLEYARSALSRYEVTSRQIHYLSLSQVSNVMADSIAKVNRLPIQQAKDLLGHRDMRVQLNLLMGLPGFMDTALDVLHASLETGLPQSEHECRSAACAIGKGHPVQLQVIVVALQDHRLECATKSNMWSKPERQDLSCTYLAHHELTSIIINIVIIIIVIIIVIIITIIVIYMILQAASRPSIDRCEGQDQITVEKRILGSWCRGGVSATAHVTVTSYSQRVRLLAKLPIQSPFCEE